MPHFAVALLSDLREAVALQIVDKLNGYGGCISLRVHLSKLILFAKILTTVVNCFKFAL